MTIQRRKITGGILSFLILGLLFPTVHANAASQSNKTETCTVSYMHKLSECSLTVTVIGEENSGALVDGSTSICAGNGTVGYKLVSGTEKKFRVTEGSGYRLTGLRYARPEKDADTYYDLMEEYRKTGSEFSITAENTQLALAAEFEKVYVPGTIPNDELPLFEVTVSGAGALEDVDDESVKITSGMTKSYTLEPQTTKRFKIAAENGKKLKSLTYRKLSAAARGSGQEVVDITSRVDAQGIFWIESSYAKIELTAVFENADGGSSSGGGTAGGDSGNTGNGSGSSASANNNNNVNITINNTGTNTNTNVSAKTGDTSNAEWYLVFLLTAAALIIFAAKKYKKVYKESE